MFRSNFIVGYPGETEHDHDLLLDFVDSAQLDWCGFFAFSPEVGTYAVGPRRAVPAGLVAERLAELRERQDAITAARRDELIGSRVEVLVDEPGTAQLVPRGARDRRRGAASPTRCRWAEFARGDGGRRRCGPDLVARP